ncbi:MAG: DUF4423 domain-containing protein [Myxococcales bacterium]|nr:DUF4423 domain-containing protein [Myxococcales bacterium]
MIIRWDKLASELLRALRGRRSRAALARRLDTSPNVIYMWEKGARAPKASVLFKLAAAARVDVRGIAAVLAPADSVCRDFAHWQAEDTSRLLEVLTKQATTAHIAKVVGVDRSTVKRWRAGLSEPRLPELLLIVHAFSHRLIDWLDALVDAGKLMEVKVLHRAVEAQRDLAYAHPWSSAVLRALELKPCGTNQVAQIAQAIGQEPTNVRDCLRHLERAQQVRRIRGRWVAQNVITVDTGTDPHGNLAQKRHWAEVAVKKLQGFDGRGESLFSYNVVAVSSEDLQRIRQAHVAFFEQVRSIVAESRAADHVALLNVQLVLLGERS